MIDKIHHVGVVLPDADEALGFFRDVMGLEVTEDRVIEEQGVRGVLLAVGENEIELLQPTRDDTGVARYLASKGPTLHHICFRTDDIRGELARLKAAEVELIDQEPRDGLAGEIAFIHPKSAHGVLIELAQPPVGSHSSNAKGFDHLAALVKDMKTASATWKQLVGIEVTNEIRPPGRGMVIGQMPISQVMIELLAAESPDSPLAKRVEENGEGASSMVAIEVQDIAGEIARYRGAGYELADAAPGPLPNSMTSTISADQSFGLAIQLIEFGS
jgi:methylmalonyl-CoA/ethylmalonyl-CoA epimerase